MPARRFTLTAEHLTLLRAANIGWNGDEYGAASIDPKRPYGNGDVVRDIHELLHPDEPYDDTLRDLTDDEWKERVEVYEQLHRDLETALQIVLVHGGFVAGVYVLDPSYGREWKYDIAANLRGASS